MKKVLIEKYFNIIIIDIFYCVKVKALTTTQ